MIQRLQLSPLLSVMFVRCSGNLHFCRLCSFVVLVISSFISGKAGEVGSLDLRSSCALIFSNISLEPALC